MRFMKPVMVIGAVCATMLTMRVVMRSRKSGSTRKRRKMMRRGR